MKNFAFISRHTPTAGQIKLAAEQGIALHHVGDIDAFSVTVPDVDRLRIGRVPNDHAFDGVIVVHPAAALRLRGAFDVGVYENANRAPEGEKPTFEAVRLHIFG